MAPPAKLACKGCRLSKVKCDLELIGEGGKCSRCARLGLMCLPTGPSKRGRAHASRDISRLGPAVRKLLHGDSPQVAMQSSRPADAGSSFLDANQSVTRLGRVVMTSAFRQIVAQQSSRSSMLAWLRQVLFVTQRQKDLGARAGGSPLPFSPRPPAPASSSQRASSRA